MANDSTHAGQVSSEQDTTPVHDTYFTDMQGEDVFFGPEQLAQANTGAAVVVPMPADQNIIRVQVNPGEILELSSPFDGGAALLGREADGNLAIKVGDVTVILVGFVDANAQAPIVVETADGQPIDIATLLASTDPAIEIQTAAGPGAEGPQGQGADNTGAILALLQGGAGLGGLNAVGAQDATQLSYSTIDNEILKEFQDTLTSPLSSSGPTGFGGMHEPFLRDPAHYFDLEPTWTQFSDFYNSYAAALGELQNQQPAPGGWADHKGTEVDPSQTVDDFIAKTTQTITIPHSSTEPESLVFNPANFFAALTPPTSDGKDLQAVTLPGDPQTIFLVRHDENGHDAIIMVFHVTEDGPQTGDFHVQVFLVNRLDHPGTSDPDHPGSDSFQDVLSIEFNTYLQGQTSGGEQSPEITPGEKGSVDILDDAPIAYDVVYKSYLGQDPDEGGSIGAALSGGGGNHASFESTDTGYVDEDWLRGKSWDNNQGNQDQDNDPSGANSDPDRGDDLGRTTVSGTLNIDFGADGAAGAGNNDALLIAKDRLALTLDHIPDTFDPNNASNQPFKDANGNILTSGGHTLYVLEHFTGSDGVEHLVVGYVIENEAPIPEAFFASGDGLSLSGEDGSCPVKVFELKLNVDPNDDSGSFQFQDFKFELCKGIDQLNNPGDPVETNTLLKFDVIGHDDDGDAVHTAINIQVNDDAPVLGDTCYISCKGGVPESVPTAFALLTGGLDLSGLSGGSSLLFSKSFGSVDEDWLSGAGNNDTDGNGANNAQQDGDDYGKTLVVGMLNVNFGGDGPKDENAYALDTFKVGDTFKDADGKSYTTGGGEFTLVVLSSDEGHLVVGYQTTGAKPIAVPIFELSLSTDPDDNHFGGFCFKLDGPIDHVGANEQTLPLKFDVTATDADDDSVTAQIEIHVNDDKPEVGITYDNNQEHGFLRDVAPDTARLDDVSVSVSEIIKTTDYGHVDEDWLKDGFSHTYTGNQDQDGANVQGDDIGKTEVTGQITVKYGGDGPSGDDAAFGLKVYTIPDYPDPLPNPTIQQLVDQNLAYNATIPAFKNVDGSSVYSGGKELQILESDAGHLLVGTPPYYVNNGGTLMLIPGTKVFEIDFTANDGKFDFKLWGAIDHVPQSGPNGAETNSLLTFQVGSATDKDGDTADAVIKIQVNDDKPMVEVTYTSENPIGGGTFGSPTYSLESGRVDEDWLGNGNHDLKYSNSGAVGGSAFENGDDNGGTTVTGGFSIKYGGDGQGTPGTAYALDSETVGSKFEDGDGHSFTSGGKDLVVITSDSHHLVVGTDANDPKSAVFTLEITDGGSFTFKLLGAMDEGTAGDNTEGDTALAFNVNSNGTDNDGDPATGQIQIIVDDDVPYAVDDCENEEVVAGNVLANDKAGADGIVVTHIASTDPSGEEGDVVSGSDTVIKGAMGVLTISSDGTWSYVADDPEANGSDVFNYTVTDGDGDTSTAQLIVTPNGTIVEDRFVDFVGTTSLRIETGPTHTVADSYDLNLTTYVSTDATKDKGYHPGDSVEINDTSLFGLTILGAANHTLKGGSGDDHIMGNAGDDNLQGRDGNDILDGGAGRDELHGGNGDDSLFGGNNDDELYGDAGHDAMSGGDGNDTFQDVDADDLDGTNTLDGYHTIDGGNGIDTVDLAGLKTFDSSQALHLENVEHLAFDGKAAGGGGTMVTLNYDAAYGITQVGGLHALSITGDKADTVHLQASGGNSWAEIGNSHVYEAGTGAAKVTVTIEQGVNVDLS